jgi:hypothetical protein
LSLTLQAIKLGFLGVSDEVYVLILPGKIDKMKVALKFIRPVLFDGPFKPDECDVLVLFNLPLLLSLLAALGNRVMLPVLYSGIDHFVVKFVWVTLSRLLTQLLDHVLLRVVVLRTTLVVSLFL